MFRRDPSVSDHDCDSHGDNHDCNFSYDGNGRDDSIGEAFVGTSNGVGLAGRSAYIGIQGEAWSKMVRHVALGVNRWAKVSGTMGAAYMR